MTFVLESALIYQKKLALLERSVPDPIASFRDTEMHDLLLKDELRWTGGTTEGRESGSGVKNICFFLRF